MIRRWDPFVGLRSYLVMSSRRKKQARGGKKSSPRSAKRATAQPATRQRLQRLLASAGFGSRRQCEELIEAGRVEVDGQVVTKLGTTVDPNANKVRVDGMELKPQKLVYYAVNKPIGYVTTNVDPQGRDRVVDLVPPSERVFPVGRLDRNSEGLILLTNDGDLAQKLTHPKFGVRKIYRVTVAGKVDGETMKQMRRGIFIAEGRATVEGARILKTRARSTELEIVLREGKNREIRRILARLGHKVQHLRRIAVGPLRLGDLPTGAYHPLTRQEIKKLKSAVEENSRRDAGEPRGKKRKGTAAKRKSTGGGHSKFVGKRAGKQGDAFAIGKSRRTSVIGGDSDSAEETSPKRRRTAKKKRAAKRAGDKPASSKGRRTKKAKSSRAQASGRRGAKRKTVATKPSQKRGSKKRKRPRR